MNEMYKKIICCFFHFLLFQEAIADMVSNVTNKLEFLGISNKGLNKFQVLLIEMEVGPNHKF